MADERGNGAGGDGSGEPSPIRSREVRKLGNALIEAPVPPSEAAYGMAVSTGQRLLWMANEIQAIDRTEQVPNADPVRVARERQALYVRLKQAIDTLRQFPRLFERLRSLSPGLEARLVHHIAEQQRLADGES